MVSGWVENRRALLQPTSKEVKDITSRSDPGHDTGKRSIRPPMPSAGTDGPKTAQYLGPDDHYIPRRTRKGGNDIHEVSNLRLSTEAYMRSRWSRPHTPIGEVKLMNLKRIEKLEEYERKMHELGFSCSVESDSIVFVNKWNNHIIVSKPRWEKNAVYLDSNTFGRYGLVVDGYSVRASCHVQRAAGPGAHLRGGVGGAF